MNDRAEREAEVRGPELVGCRARLQRISIDAGNRNKSALEHGFPCALVEHPGRLQAFEC